jgi:ribosomal protein S18 acetylase RimI-like enzyme
MIVPGYSLRRATAADSAIVRTHRRAMFESMGLNDPATLDAMDAAFAVWLAERFADGHYVGLFACTEGGSVVAGVGLWLMEWPPTFHSPQPMRGYLLNVYTEPEHRRRGLAHGLVQACMTECADRGVGMIVLHASDEGRPVYEGLGFQQANEMRLYLKGGP